MSHALAVQAQLGPVGPNLDETWAVLLVIDWFPLEDREGSGDTDALGIATIINAGLTSFKDEPVQFDMYRGRGKHHGSGWDWTRLASDLAGFLNKQAENVGREPLQVVRIKDLDSTLLGTWQPSLRGRQ